MASVACAATLHRHHDAVAPAALPRLPRHTTLAVCANPLCQAARPTALHARSSITIHSLSAGPSRVTHVLLIRGAPALRRPAATAFWLSSLRPVPRLTATVLLSDIESRVASIRRRRPPVTESSLHTVAFFLALGLTPARVLDLFSRVPSLLKSRWHHDLLPKFHVLLAAGVDLPSMLFAVNSIPNWLRCEVGGLTGVVEFLQAMGVRARR
ncbi:hypothetical protein CLOM_g10851 [Closterium sp. NIES-68]|nr:hypothetical protein CLOM_g10851 [Closterium sp. NIES-68]